MPSPGRTAAVMRDGPSIFFWISGGRVAKDGVHVRTDELLLSQTYGPLIPGLKSQKIAVKLQAGHCKEDVWLPLFKILLNSILVVLLVKQHFGRKLQ